MSSKLLLLSALFITSIANAGDRVLIVGDSHIAGDLGQTLHENFQHALIPVSSYGLVGANPANLIPGIGKAQKLGATFRENGKAPSGKGLRSIIQQQTQMVLEVLQGASPKPACFWVTPNWGPIAAKTPYWKTDARLKQVIEGLKTSLAGKCTVIDSTTLVKRSEVPTNPDGLHYTSTAYKNWGNAVYSEIRAKMTQPKSQASPCPTCGEK